MPKMKGTFAVKGSHHQGKTPSPSSPPHPRTPTCLRGAIQQHIVITPIDELPVHPPSNYSSLIAPISMVGKERVGGWEKEAEDHLLGLCHSLGMVGWRMKSSGLTHPDSSATGGGHAQRGSPTERSLLVIMALIKRKGGWNGSDFFFYLHLSTLFRSLHFLPGIRSFIRLYLIHVIYCSIPKRGNRYTLHCI